jgi:signal peptidase I
MLDNIKINGKCKRNVRKSNEIGEKMSSKKFYGISFSILVFLGIVYIFNMNFGINYTDSVQRGIYMYEKAKNIKKGDIIIFDVDEKWKRISVLRNIKNLKVRFMKRIVADSKDKLEIIDNSLYVNGEDYGKYIEKLPRADIKINEGEYWVLSKKKNSLDSRYFGSIKESEIEKKAKLIYAFN